jgi:hypothetical protein
VVQRTHRYSMRSGLRNKALGVLAALTAVGCWGGTARPDAGSAANAAPRSASLASESTRHYEYVFPDQAIDVYDIDHRHRLVQQISLPGISGIRGVVTSPRTHMLYISHGGDGGANGSGSLLKYDLVAGGVVWDRRYSSGIDSMAISRDGARIYMPDGELSDNGTWNVIDASSGDVIDAIQAGLGPHNTIAGLSGAYVYLGGRNSPYLNVASTATNQITKRIGPLRSGVRPFTINGRETLAYTTATGFLGFQVSSIATGRVLFTSGFGHRFRWNPAHFGPSAPSHGISLSPDERQLWVIDAPNNYVHVFDVTKLPRRAPRRIADIKLRDPLTGSEVGCSYDCDREGWLQHSRSGCFVYVGDSGDVFSTVTFKRVAFLPALRNTRKHLEIDWRRGLPVATSTRSGLGYVRKGRPPRRSSCGHRLTAVRRSAPGRS